ncbi:hypothetical protein B0H11DRAFT_2263571, partial [Mycena galericulata]
MPPKGSATASSTDATSKKVKKKPGNKGDFSGQREKFLLEKLDDYMDYSKRGKTREWWPILFNEYWAKFDWRLGLDVEPDANPTPPDANLTPPDGNPTPPSQTEDANPTPPDGNPAPTSQTEEEELSPEDARQKTKTQTEMRMKIKTWYNHKRTSLGMTRNPFTPWLARLRRPAESPPKRITDYQFYMQHDDYKANVSAEFDAKHWDAPREKALSLRCGIARKLFEAEPQEVKTKIRNEAKAERDEEFAKWKDADEGLPSIEPEEQIEARQRFAGVVSPLLLALQAYTGYHVTLIAGRVAEDNKFDL